MVIACLYELNSHSLFSSTLHNVPATSLMPIDGETQMIGCGCEQDKVANIVAELKKRQAYRGDRAKIRLAETTLSSIKELNAKVRA